MANYNLTQTGAEVQELLNKVSLFGKFTCSDAADSQVKNIHIDDFTLIDGMAIAVTFVNGNSVASIQLNVNYTGNVPVYYRDSPLGNRLVTANATVILMYNATGNRWDVLSELCGTIGEAASRDVATEITDESSDEDIPTVGAVKGNMKNVVYDISAAHPDGQGNPTPYADLTAALGTGGVNIPEDIRKGGMSIKFIQGTVQSSDNKYVQYRYMNSSTAVADFTNIDNWQGIDDTLKAGTQNVVKSSGIISMLCKDNRNRVPQNSVITGYNIRGSYYSSGAGEKAANENAKIVVYSLTAGRYYLTGRMPFATGISALALYQDAQCTELIKVVTDSTNSQNYELYLDISASCYLGASCPANTNESNVWKSIITPLIENFADIPQRFTYTKESTGFGELKCTLNKGDAIYFEGIGSAEITDIYLRPTYQSSTGQVLAQKTVSENGFYIVASIDIESLLIYVEVAGSFIIKNWKVNEGIPDNAVTTPKIANNAVTNEKIDDNAVTSQKIAQNVKNLFISSSERTESLYSTISGYFIKGSSYSSGVGDIAANANSQIIVFKAFANIKYNIYGYFNLGGGVSGAAAYRDASCTNLITILGDSASGSQYSIDYTPTEDCYIAATCSSSQVLSSCVSYRQSYRLKTFGGKKCIFIGDSISTSNSYKWKGILEQSFGLEYVRDGSGLWPANGGIKLIPPQVDQEPNTLKSIWYRCAENRMAGYEFDMISLFGGTNDMTNSAMPVGDVDTDGAYVNIADIIPYVDDASSFATPSNYTDVWSSGLTYAQCLMGCLEMLHRDFPGKPIAVCSVMPCHGTYGNWIYQKEGSPMNGVTMSERMAIIAMRIVNHYYNNKGWMIYGVPFYWGVRTVTSIAAFTLYINSTQSVDGVHPNYICAVRMANMFNEAVI